MLWMSHVKLLKRNLVRFILYSIALLGSFIRNPALLPNILFVRALKIKKDNHVEACSLYIAQGRKLILFFHID